MRLRLLLAVALVQAAVGLAVAHPWTSEDAATPAATGTLTVEGPARITAGEPAAFQLRGASPDVDAATVVLTSTAGTLRTTVSLRDGAGELRLAAASTTSTGVTTLWAIAGADTASTLVQVEPGPVVAPLVALVGPKSITADGDDHAMVVTLPTDRFGNPVTDVGGLRLAARHPDGTVEDLGVRQTGLVSWQRVVARILAGRTELTLRFGAADGPVADLDEVAGRPVPFTLAIDPGPYQADGDRLYAVRSSRLVDRFGNVVPDGTAVQLTVVTAVGRGQATAVTIDGRAELRLEAPTAPGPVTMVASSAGVRSAPLVVTFTPAVLSWTATAVARAGGTEVRVGPVRTIDGGWVPDGTVAVLTDGDRRLSFTLDGGSARVPLSWRLGATARLEILGVQRPVTP